MSGNVWTDLRDLIDAQREHSAEPPPPRGAGNGHAEEPVVLEGLDQYGLERAFNVVSVEARYNERTGFQELRRGKGPWMANEDMLGSRLRQEIADRCVIERGKAGVTPARFSVSAYTEALQALLHDKRVDPILLWADTLKWDGEERLDELLQVAFSVDLSKTDIELARWASTYLILAPLQRARTPGCMLQEVPILTGPGGIGKSSLLKAILPPHLSQYFSDDVSLSSNSRDRVESIIGPSLVELAEMTGYSRADRSDAKAFITREVDRQRMPYQRYIQEFPRRCAMVGTANEETLMDDGAGLRRWVSIHLADGDPGALARYMAENRDLLWAEADQMLKKGQSARLPRHLAKAQEASNEHGRLADDDWEAKLSEWRPLDDEFTIDDALDELKVKEPNMRDQRRAGDALRALGYRKRHVRRGNVRAYLWSRPE